ncbi:MAG: chemotaxis protein CheW [Phycisphaerales bacterium JB059]
MTNATATSARSGPTTAETNEDKFLTFRLGREEYGVEILRVREIIGLIDITPLPHTPDYVRGVINLRGKIIPVIELRTKFGLAPVAYTEATCVIVVEVEDGENAEQLQMGVIVDTVSEVMDIRRDLIEPAPRFGTGAGAESILGMGKVESGDTTKVVILLDIDRVLSGADSKSIQPDAETPVPCQDPDSRPAA